MRTPTVTTLLRQWAGGRHNAARSTTSTEAKVPAPQPPTGGGPKRSAKPLMVGFVIYMVAVLVSFAGTLAGLGVIATLLMLLLMAAGSVFLLIGAHRFVAAIEHMVRTRTGAPTRGGLSTQHLLTGGFLGLLASGIISAGGALTLAASMTGGLTGTGTATEAPTGFNVLTIAGLALGLAGYAAILTACHRAATQIDFLANPTPGEEAPDGQPTPPPQPDPVMEEETPPAFTTPAQPAAQAHHHTTPVNVAPLHPVGHTAPSRAYTQPTTTVLEQPMAPVVPQQVVPPTPVPAAVWAPTTPAARVDARPEVPTPPAPTSYTPPVVAHTAARPAPAPPSVVATPPTPARRPAPRPAPRPTPGPRGAVAPVVPAPPTGETAAPTPPSALPAAPPAADFWS